MTDTVETPPVSFEALELLATGSFWFEAKGNCVVFKNRFFLFGDDGEEAPEKTLLVAQPIRGNFGTVVEATDVAQLFADVLNQRLSPRKYAEEQKA